MTVYQESDDLKNFFITTGEKSNFYTLRAEKACWNGSGHRYYVEIHLQNLSTDKDKAIDKARALTGLDFDTSLKTKAIGEKTPVDWSVIRFGKHYGTPIEDVPKDYLIFVIEKNYVPSSAMPQYEALKALVEDDLEARSQEREREIAAAKQANSPLIDAFGRDWLENAKKFADGFLGDVARQVLNGEILSERQLEILTEIRAKAEGRRNSKAYKAKYDKLYGVLENYLG